MSFEGYVEYLCEDGHYNRLDASYLWDMHTPTCTQCARPVAWSRMVDETNGVDPDDPATLPYAELEVRTPERTERCSLGHLHVTVPTRYHIPGATTDADPVYVVTTEVTFRHRYLVAAPSPERAAAYLESQFDSNDPPESWQQSYQGETVYDVERYTPERLRDEHADESRGGSPWIPVESCILHDED